MINNQIIKTENEKLDTKDNTFFLGQGYLDLFNLLCNCGAEEPTLETALQTNNINLVYAVVTSGFDTELDEELDDDGTTALMLAIKRCNIEIIQFLLSEGAEIHIKNEKHETPLSIAKNNNRKDVIEMLKQVHQGKKITYKKDKTTAISDKDYIEEIKDGLKMLKRNGFCINDLDGPVPLNEAIKQNNMNMVDALLYSGIDVNVCDFDENENAYSLAKKLGNEELLAKIIKFGGNGDSLEYDDSEYDDL